MDKFLINLRTHHLWPNRKVENQTLLVGVLVILFITGVVDKSELAIIAGLIGVPAVGWLTPTAKVHMEQGDPRRTEVSPVAQSQR